MKKLIMVTMITACLALCAAVWPQTEVVKKVPTPAPTSAVSAPEPPVAELKTKVEAAPQTEKEKTEIPKQAPHHEVISEPETASMEPAAAPEPVPEPMPESIPAPEIIPAPESTPEPTPTAIDSQPGDMVYVPGFGWIESQGPNHVEYAEDMYENGNKIGIMG
ncbi:MAG: DUF6550 family protein [Candidatus Heteroscillospira sp.]|jgi:hypothetical protein